jgi:hypothetical protein
MARKINKLAMLVKPETVYATDSVPTGAANAIQVSNVEINPLAGNDVSRDLIKANFGHQGVILVQNHVTIAFDVEIAGAGAAGTAPAWGPIMRGCGRSEVIDAGVDVQYVPDNDSGDSVTMYYLLDGVRHIAIGGRGNVSWTLTPGQIPRFRFSMTALLGTITDEAMPAVDYSDFIRPKPVSKPNTTMSLHGWSAIAESLSIDVANQVEPRFLIGHESVEITNRQSTGVAVVEAASLATKNWFQIAQEGTLGALAVQHGTAAGNIVEFNADAGVQIGRLTQGASQGIANYSLPLMFTGDPDLVITVR